MVVGLVACTKAGSTQDPALPPEPTFAQPPEAKMPPPTPAPPPPPATVSRVTVQMTSATLADDCGGGPPAPKAKAKSALKADESASGGRARRACDQSSMQLSVVAAPGGSPTLLTVKKVELFDDKGALIGELTPRTPTVWSQNGTYQAWDGTIAPAQELAVSYALSQPPWGNVTSRWNRTYVLKAVLTVGGGDQAVQRDVQIAAPTFLPPNVKT